MKPSYSAVVLADKPAGYWFLDSAADSSIVPTTAGGVTYGALKNPLGLPSAPQFMTDAVLTAPLTSGQVYTSLAVSPLPAPIPSGVQVALNWGGNYLIATSQFPTTNGAVAAGATSIPVVGFTANANYAVGTPVDYLGALDTGFVMHGGGAFAVELWVKLQVVRYNFPRLISTATYQAANGWALHMSASDGQYYSWNFCLWQGVNSKVLSVPYHSDGLWHQLVFVYDGTNMYTYVDGANKSAPLAGPAGWTQGPLAVALGATQNGGGSYGEQFIGGLSFVSVYNYALNDTQIARHYTYGKALQFDTTTLPQVAHVYNGSTGAFRSALTPLNFEPVELIANGAPKSVTLRFDKALTGANAPVRGDKVTLTEDDGDGAVIGTYVVEDLPDVSGDQGHVFEMLLEPWSSKLQAPFTTNYTVATDTGQIARDIFTAASLSYDTSSVPLTGVTAIYDFSTGNASCLNALDELRKMTSTQSYWWLDANGKGYFAVANLASATHSVKIAAQTSAIKTVSPVAKRVNIVNVKGALVNGVQLSATYDNSAGSPLGKRVLTPELQYPDCNDPITLQNIANTVGAALDRQFTTVDLTVLDYPTRIKPGDTLRYFEESKDERGMQVSAGAGTYSPVYFVQSVKYAGPTQQVVCSDIALTVDDLKYEIARMLDRVSVHTGYAVTVNSTGAITPAMMGSTTPATPAGLSLASAVELSAQVDNVSIAATWTPNASSDKIVRYELQWRRGADTNYTVVSAATSPTKLYGFAAGQSYGFSIRAVNNIGNASAWSTEVTVTGASDTTGPATPTGLSAIKTPRGALVSWTANTEADLQGYDLQVSIGGGAYSVVMTNALVTSFAYVAPSGTAQGTSLAFEVRARDWSGNASAWSAASAAVSTDGVVFDELLAGNLRVFGTLTTGGLQTASSGARIVLDSTSLRIYDASATNYGAPSGAGVRVELKNDGTGFFSGTLAAAGVKASYVFGTTADSNVPALPMPPVTNGVGSFMLDPANGLRFWSGNGTAANLIAQWAANGTLTIFSGASIYASSVATSQTTGNNTDSSGGFKLSGNYLDIYGSGGAFRLWGYNTSSSTWQQIGVFQGIYDSTFGNPNYLLLDLSGANGTLVLKTGTGYIRTSTSAGLAFNTSQIGTLGWLSGSSAPQPPLDLTLFAYNGFGTSAGTGYVAFSSPVKLSKFFARAHATSAQSLANATWTKLSLQSADFDPNGNFDVTTNYRYTAAQTGYYHISGRASIAANGRFLLAAYVNGTEHSRGTDAPGTSGNTSGAVVVDIVFLNKNDYVELWGYQTTGAAANTENAASPDAVGPYLAVHYLTS